MTQYFKFFHKNDKDSYLINKWEPIGFLNNSRNKLLIARVLELSVNFVNNYNLENEPSITCLLPMMARIYNRMPKMQYSDEEITESIIHMHNELSSRWHLIQDLNANPHIDAECELVSMLAEHYLSLNGVPYEQ